MSFTVLSHLSRFRGTRLWHLRRRVRLAIDLVILITLCVTMAYLTNVSTTVRSEDEAVFSDLLGLSAGSKPAAFDDEIALIREIQNEILTRAPINRGIPQFESREPANLFRMGYGLCYDRSRTIEKALKFVGFRTRHVYVLYSDGRSLIRALLTYRQPSHAVTEVMTSRGWLTVDSNNRWISLTKQNLPVPADMIAERKADFISVPDSIANPCWVFRGLYSRKGFFYRPYLPFPEANWTDFFFALIE